MNDTPASLPDLPTPDPSDPPYLQGLNGPQRQAVLTTEGPVLMLAGAGTGKTAALTARLAHIMATRRAWPSEILAVTFTNKAAREMRERIGRMVGDVVEGMPWLGTFHSIAAKMLRRHAAQDERQLSPRAVLLIRREHGNQSFNRPHAVARVKRGEDEMPRLRSPERRANSVRVAYLANEYHVGILAERLHERRVEAHGVATHLPLVYEAPGGLVDVLDRVLERDDVVGTREVDPVQDRGQRR